MDAVWCVVVDCGWKLHSGKFVSTPNLKYVPAALVQAVAEFDTTLAGRLASATTFTGVSKTIQNDIIESAAHVIQEEIDKEINTASFIAVEVDDTT